MHEQWAGKFWARVAKSDGCWLWTGSRLPKGYGRFYPKWKVGLYAHVVSWEMHNGRPVPPGLEVMHACDNPPCVRPDHLSVGTKSDNMRDMVRKGRAARMAPCGEAHPAHKLTAADVRAIRERWAAGGIRQRELASEYGVSRALIGQIVRGKAWRAA